MRSHTMIIAALAVGAAAACSSPTETACTASGAGATIEASDAQQFSPSSATIKRGQTVCWLNSGSISHTVTSDDGTSFNHSLPTTSTATQQFPGPGSFPFHCNYHTGMKGTIIVT